MKIVLGILALLCVTSVPASAQTGIAGAWRAEGPGESSWTLVLRAVGSRLTGRVSSCTSLPVQIYDGKVEGSTFTFKCQSPGGERVVTVKGSVTGDDMLLTWAKRVRDGGTAQPASATLDPGDASASAMFGASTSGSFTARRVRESGVEIAAALNLVEKGLKVEGTIFLPPNVRRVRAVIVVLNSGRSWTGMGGAFYGDSELRKLSETLELGLLLPRITPIREVEQIDVLRNADVGGADSLLMLLRRLAGESGHQELIDAPLLLWGHSRTGHFAATFAALHPQRTIALVGYHAGGAGLAGPDIDVLRYIPTLLLEAKRDIEQNSNRPGWPSEFFAETSWRNARSLDAPWTFGIEPDAVHQNPSDLKTANALVIPWISAVLRARLSRDGQGLRAVGGASAWLGNIRTGEITPHAMFLGSKHEANWLPDEESARGWRVVVGSAK